MRTTPRPRRVLGPVCFAILFPLLRWSHSREAYVLRLVGNRVGPVVRRRPPHDDTPT